MMRLSEGVRVNSKSRNNFSPEQGKEKTETNTDDHRCILFENVEVVVNDHIEYIIEGQHMPKVLVDQVGWKEVRLDDGFEEDVGQVVHYLHGALVLVKADRPVRHIVQVVDDVWGLLNTRERPGGGCISVTDNASSQLLSAENVLGIHHFDKGKLHFVNNVTPSEV